MKQIVLFGLSATILTGMIAPNAIASEIFGRDGRNGSTGRSGRNGTAGIDQSIRATSVPQSFNLFGGDGESGDNGDSGENAYSCNQPRDAAHDLRGANGGDGGSGGDGGNGGNGGQATIFYTNLADLKNLQLNNAPGRGGRSGRSGQAGRGCTPDRTNWTIEQCEWTLMRRTLNVLNDPWQQIESHREDCQGDRHRSLSRRHRNSTTHEFKWDFRGVVSHNRYQATAGRDGNPGRDGRDGAMGNYGALYLVPGDSIPAQTLAVTHPIASINGQSIDLLKNNWLNQTGLSSSLAAGSNIPQDYKLLQTVRNQFQVDWETPKAFSLLGDPKIAVAIDVSGNLSFDIPGHLEYRQTRQADRTQIAIINGIAPDRLKQVKFRGFEQFKDARNFALIDEGKLLKEIAGLTVKVSVSDQNQTIEESYPIDKITVLGDIYKMQLSEKFTALLQPGTPLTYNFQIQQTTRSGANYRSGIRVKQVVDQVTFPQVEYLPALE